MAAPAMREKWELCLADGMDDFISKPVNYKGIGQIITATLSRPE
jgi:CheY-like chemotaxis protein